jgi:hypothetical protein
MPVEVTRSGLMRLVVGYTTIACALPYLALKIVWLTGGQLGVADPILTTDPTMIALNAVTAFMDLAAIAIALAFTHRWGLHIPAWLLLPPMWVAAGLLSRFVVVVPPVVISMVLARDSVRVPPGGPVEPWVYAVVYTGFTGMGIGLLFAFALYVKARWRLVFDSPPQPAHCRETLPVLVPLATAGAIMAAAGSALPLAWAFGSTVGVRADLAAGRTFSSYFLNATNTALGLGAAAGILMLVHGFGRRIPYWVLLTVTWIGSGSLFAWGLWHVINVLGSTALLRDRVQGMALVNVMSLVRCVAGLVIGWVLLFIVAEGLTPPDRGDDPASLS